MRSRDLGSERQRILWNAKSGFAVHLRHCLFLLANWNLPLNAIHGGRNEAFAVGFSRPGREVLDLDLCGAYTTAMALISVPNWSDCAVH